MRQVRSLTSKKSQGPRAEGNGWESSFLTIAMLQGFKTKKIPEMGRWIGPGTFKPIKSWCDYMLINTEGKVAFIDTKTTANDSFAFSAINPDQVKFFREVGDLVPAGYVVYFRENNKVNFMPWELLERCRPTESLSKDDGIPMGHLTNFAVSKIFS